MNIAVISSNWHNKNVMTREIDIIKKQEGW